MKSYSDKTTPDSLKAMKPDTTAPEDDGELDNDDISDGEGGPSAYADKGLGLGSENEDHFNTDTCLTKRAKNNSRERERKEKIKNDMMELKAILPSEMQTDKKQTHHDLLQLAIGYIRSLLYQSNNLKLNQVNASSNQNTQSTDIQVQKEMEDLRLELAKYKSFLSNAGLQQGIDLSQILINWRFKTPEELLYNPNINVDINLPIFQQQQQQQQQQAQQQQVQQQFFTQQQQQQQQPQQQSFNQFQSQGIFQNISGNHQAIAQFSAMTNQGQQIQQQVAFNQNLQQISFAQQSFSLTHHSTDYQQQQQQQQQQEQFHQNLGFVQQNIQTSTFEVGSVSGLCPQSNEGLQTSACMTDEASSAGAGTDPSQNPFQDFLAAPEVQEFATSTALQATQSASNSVNATIVSSSAGSGVVISGASSDAGNDSILSVKDDPHEMNNTSLANTITSNNVSTSFAEEQKALSNDSLTGLLSANECADEMTVTASSSSAGYMSFDASTADPFSRQAQQHQQPNTTSFNDAQMKSSTSFSIAPDGSNYISDCNVTDPFKNMSGMSQLQQQQQQQQQQFQQVQQHNMSQQQFHFGSNGELLSDGSGGNPTDSSQQHQQTVQGSLILQNGQLILVNNNGNLSTNGNMLNGNAGNGQQMHQNFFMQPQQHHNVLAQQGGFLGSVGQPGNMTIQTDHNHLLGQQQGATQFIGPNGSINILTGHGLQTNVAQAGGSVFQNSMGILNPVNVLGNPVTQNFNQPQAQMMMPQKANDQPQALILPDGQIIPVVTQPNLLFPSQQCIPVTGSLLVPSVGASQNRACGLSNILSAKPQPVMAMGSQRSKKKQQQSAGSLVPPSVQNVTLPPSMTAVLTPEGNVILSFPNASVGQNIQPDNKAIGSIPGSKSGQRPLMPKPAGIVQQPQQNFFETKMFAPSHAPFFQNVLNIQHGASQSLPVMPLIQHSQIIQQMPVSNVSSESHDSNNRGIECISPAGPPCGDSMLQSQEALLGMHSSNLTQSNPFTQMTSVGHGSVGGYQTMTNVNEVTTSTGSVDPSTTSEVKKKLKKKKKKKKSLSSAVVPMSEGAQASEVIQDGGSVTLKTGGEFSCMQEKEVDITDFSDLIRMEPMTPKPPDTSGRLTPTNQLAHTPTIQHIRTPAINTPVVVSQARARQVQDVSGGIKNEEGSSRVNESLDIPRALLEEVVNCTLGNMVGDDFSDSMLIMEPQKDLLPEVVSSTSTQTFSTVTISPSLISVVSTSSLLVSSSAYVPCTSTSMEALTKMTTPYSNHLSSFPCSTVEPVAVDNVLTSSVKVSGSPGSKTMGRRKGKRSKKNLGLEGGCPTDSSSISGMSLTPFSTSTMNFSLNSIGNTAHDFHSSMTTTSTSSLSARVPITSVIPVILDQEDAKKGSRKSRAKLRKTQSSYHPAETPRFEADDAVAAKESPNQMTPPAAMPVKAQGRRTRSQSKSQEMRDYQASIEASLAELGGNVEPTFSDFDISSPLSKRKMSKSDQWTDSALKEPSLSVSASSRHLVVSVEKLDAGQTGDMTNTNSTLQTKSGSSTYENFQLKSVVPNKEGISSSDCAPQFSVTTATTEEGTQTLRSELKSKIKLERRAKKLQEKKKKGQPANSKDQKGLMNNSGDHSKGRMFIDDSVQLDMELFNLVDQVERNMAASTQTELKSRRGQKAKMTFVGDEQGDTKRLKVDESSQSSRGKDNPLTMKLKRVDNQSNFVVESPIDFNIESPGPTNNNTKPNSPAVSCPIKVTVQNFASVTQTHPANANLQVESGSFYGSRYLPAGGAASTEVGLMSSRAEGRDPSMDDGTQNSNASKPYYVLKQPNLSQRPEEDGNFDSGGKKFNKDDGTPIEEKGRVGHTILQSLARNMVAPSKQVASKMSAQTARMRPEESSENEGRPEGKNEKRGTKRVRSDANEKPASGERGCARDKEITQNTIPYNNAQDPVQVRNPHNAQQQIPSPNCYDLSMPNQKPDKHSREVDLNTSKPLSQCMGQESLPQACSQERQIMPACALTPESSKTPENQRKPLPSCRQEKDKKTKDSDLCRNSRDQVDCSYQSKPMGGSLPQQGEYQMQKQQDGSCQSNRRRSRQEEEDKRSNSVGYHHPPGANYLGNSVQGNHPGHSYYKNDQGFAGAHHPYYVSPYFDVFHASSARFNPALSGLPFEPSTPLNFFRDCASVFPAFQSPSGSFGTDLSYQRNMNPSGKDTLDGDNRRSVESNHSNRNSLESNSHGSHQQQQQQQNNPTPTLPSCKSAGSSSYLDNQQHQATDKSSMSKQSSNAKKSSKTSMANYESSAVFDAANPFFSFSGLSPNKSHHPAHLSSPYFGSSSFFQDATRNISKGSSGGAGSRTLHHRSLEEGFNKTSPSASTGLGLDFSSQDFSNGRNSVAHQQGRANFIGNSMPAHHHSFGFGTFFSDTHQMGSSLAHRGAQPAASNYYNSYNQQQASMGSNGLSRNGGISRGFNPEMAFNHFWGHQQATFDPTRAIGNPFSPNPFSM